MLTRFSVNRPYTVFVSIIIIIILGLISYANMGLDFLPNINLPYAMVVTSYPGASPDLVESLVTVSLEQAMLTIKNISQIQSVSFENISYIILKFNEGTNMDSALIEMRECLDLATGYLPKEAGSPKIIKINPDMMPVLVASLSIADKDLSEASGLIKQKILPDLQSLEGVANISVTGLVEDYINVVISRDKLDSFNSDLAKFYRQEAEKEIREAASEQIISQIDKGIQDKVDSLAAFGIRPEASMEMVQANRDRLIHQAKDQIDEIVEKELAKLDIPKLDISQDLVQNLIMSQNLSLPAGAVDSQEGILYPVRVGDKIKGIEELESMVVVDIPGYKSARLGDLANIYKNDNRDQIYSRVNGKPALILSVLKQPDYSTTDLTNDFLKKVEDLSEQYPGLSFEYLVNQGNYVNMMIDTVLDNLLIGSLLAVLVLISFLRHFKPTLILAASIAISLVTSFVLMYFSGVTLNVISMGGLALGVGMLVDNSIVVIENIYRMIAQGMSRKKAALQASKEVAGPILSSTLTTIIVFLPLLFIKGLTRQIFTDMALTISFSLAASLLTALSLVPAISAKYLKETQIKKKSFSLKLTSSYLRLLEKSLGYKKLTIGLCLLLFVLSIVAGLKSGRTLLPQVESESISLEVTMPDSYSYEDSFKALDRLYEDLTLVDGLSTIGVVYKADELDLALDISNMLNTSDASIDILLDKNSKRSSIDIYDDIARLADTSDLDIKITDTNQEIDSISGGKVVVNLFGEDKKELSNAALVVERIIRDVEGTRNVENGLDKLNGELKISIDKDKAIAKGLTSYQVFSAVNQALGENTPITLIGEGATYYKLLVSDDRQDFIMEDGLASLECLSQDGDRVRIDDIASVEKSQGYSSLRRLDQKRYVSVSAGLKAGYRAGDVNTIIEKKLKEHSFSKGIKWQIGGEQEMIKKTYRDLLVMLVLAIIFIYLVMVAQFQSLLSPFIIMFTIPLAFTGGLLALYLARMPISAVALIGLVLLVGVVVNNGIVFVDYANMKRKQGYSKKEAILYAAKNRIRPILMTALTTIFALITMVFDNSTGGEMMRPMAVVAIGGLVYSTALTLFFIPALYMLGEKVKGKR